jgi:hypothetical protein
VQDGVSGNPDREYGHSPRISVGVQ